MYVTQKKPQTLKTYFSDFLIFIIPIDKNIIPNINNVGFVLSVLSIYAAAFSKISTNPIIAVMYPDNFFGLFFVFNYSTYYYA